MQSNGGLVSPAIARDFPVRIIESGPAAGILMCAEVGSASGFNEILTFDMGGTTATLGAIDDGTPAIMPTLEVDLVRHRRGSGLPINVPAIEMLEIGAGGGSIARVDRGMIAVGPDSAGAAPGPMCYARGGTQPTLAGGVQCRRDATGQKCRHRWSGAQCRRTTRSGGRSCRVGRSLDRNVEHAERTSPRLD